MASLRMPMHGVTAVFVKLGVRLLVFALVLWLASKRNADITIHRKWSIPLVAALFAVLNTALYVVLHFVLNIATFGAVTLVLPVLINLVLLLVTLRLVESRKWIEVKGVMATLYLAVAFALAHGALWVGLEYLPKHI